MNLIIISNINILLVIIKEVYSESDDSYDQSQSHDQDEYDEDKTHYHRLRHNKKPKYPPSNMMPYPTVPNGFDYNYNEDDCDCSCEKCNQAKPCCREFCINCQAMNQQNMYYINYPPVPQYPAPVPPYQAEMPNSTMPEEYFYTSPQWTPSMFTMTTTTTTTTTPTTPPPPPPISTQYEIESPPTSPPPTTSSTDPRREAVIEVSDIYINENIRNNDAKYILTSLRRTKPYWQANRVVPIPNNLAERLMTQMKDDKPTIRRVY